MAALFTWIEEILVIHFFQIENSTPQFYNIAYKNK